MKINASYLLLIIAIILTYIIHSSAIFGNSQSIANTKTAATAPAAHEHVGSWETIENRASQHLNDSLQVAYRDLGNSEGELAYSEKAAFWQSQGHTELMGHFMAEKSKLEKSEKSLNFATPLLIEILHQEPNSDIKSLLADDILSLSALGNDFYASKGEWEYYEAVALIEGKQETMAGVQKLLAITRENPEDIKSNIMLAQLAVQSGQYDKAIDRLKKLLNRYNNNSEAMFILAEAYKQSGDVKEAKRWLEACKKEVNNPDFSAEIDDYMKTF